MFLTFRFIKRGLDRLIFFLLKYALSFCLSTSILLWPKVTPNTGLESVRYTVFLVKNNTFLLVCIHSEGFKLITRL